jgi:hypothetical protein
MSGGKGAAAKDFVAESRFKVIAAGGKETEVRMRVSRPVARKDGNGVEVWDAWLFVDPGLPAPTKPLTGFSSMDVMAKALFVCKTILVNELKAKKIRNLALEPFEPGKKGVVTIGEFFHDWDAGRK